MLGIDWRDPARDRAVAFAHETGVTYPLVADTSGEVVRNKVLPRLILVDASGDGRLLARTSRSRACASWRSWSAPTSR